MKMPDPIRSPDIKVIGESEAYVVFVLADACSGVLIIWVDSVTTTVTGDVVGTIVGVMVVIRGEGLTCGAVRVTKNGFLSYALSRFVFASEYVGSR
jgi:hypothetical protein